MNARARLLLPLLLLGGAVPGTVTLASQPPVAAAKPMRAGSSFHSAARARTTCMARCPSSVRASSS